MRIPTHRSPTHPGEMLLEEFLIPMELTQRELADALHVPYQRVNELVKGKQGMTPGTALRGCLKSLIKHLNSGDPPKSPLRKGDFEFRTPLS